MGRLESVKFYEDARKKIIELGYDREITWAENVNFEDQTPHDLMREYVWVVVNSGMKNQVAERIFKRFSVEGIDAITHKGKKDAIKQMFEPVGKDRKPRYQLVFEKLKELNDVEKIEYFEKLKWIGGITKYHLAKNLGIDCAKPDRHLVRLAEKFGYENVQDLCMDISKDTGDRVGVIDVVLWRYANLFGSNGMK